MVSVGVGGGACCVEWTDGLHPGWEGIRSVRSVVCGQGSCFLLSPSLPL